MFKKGNKKGFTLIELMIVIAIIGILAVTIVPTLTGAQGRARDTGRKANVNNCYTALITYQQDFGNFPSQAELNSSEVGCFSDDAGIFESTDSGDYLGELFSGKKATLDPQKGRMSNPCGIANSLGYSELSRDDVEAQSFILTTNVEASGNANAAWEGATSNNVKDAVVTKKTVEAVAAVIEVTTKGDIKETNDIKSGNSLYVKYYE